MAYDCPIDLPAFFRGVMNPPSPDPEGAVERAQEIAEIGAGGDAYNRAVAELWESVAPMEWVDRRSGPSIFLGRRHPPVVPVDTGVRARQEAFTYGTYGRPTTTELAAAMASNPAGVATCQALGEEAIDRAQAWYGELAPRQVAWALMSPRWHPAQSTMRRDGAAHQAIGTLGQRAVRGADARITGPSLWDSFGSEVSDLCAKHLRSEEVRRQDGETEASWSNALAAAQTMLLQWSHKDFARRLGLSAPERETWDRIPTEPFVGRKLTDLPDALDPLLSIVGHGYFPFWMDQRFLVIGVPWNHLLISASSWGDLWQAPEDFSALLF